MRKPSQWTDKGNSTNAHVCEKTVSNCAELHGATADCQQCGAGFCDTSRFGCKTCAEGFYLNQDAAFNATSDRCLSYGYEYVATVGHKLCNSTWPHCKSLEGPGETDADQLQCLEWGCGDYCDLGIFFCSECESGRAFFLHSRALK